MRVQGTDTGGFLSQAVGSVFFSSAYAFRGSPAPAGRLTHDCAYHALQGTERGDARLPQSCRLEQQERNVPEPADLPSCCSDTPPPREDVAFRHSGWQPDRRLIRQALRRSDASDSRIAAWDGCGSDAWVLRAEKPPHRLKIVSGNCHDRFCVPCANDRSARLGRRIREKVPACGISFLTVTLVDSDVPLTELIDKLVKSFRRLRAWKRWKERVAGGVAFIEIKWNAKLARWHPHLHAIMETAFIPKAEISDEWRRITGTSFIVDIKRPPSAESIIRYVTKYGSKALDQSFVSDPERLDEAIEALKGRHLCSVFGTWRGWALTDDDEAEEWQPVDTLVHLLARERRGDDEAHAIMEQLRCGKNRPKNSATKSRSPPSPSLSTPAFVWTDQHGAWDAVPF